ncbi:MAG TPA: hypothetical protein VFM18_01820 [Methanosarcina sp.]|nr:hypothetical protein [Methanosarcina sp.]
MEKQAMDEKIFNHVKKYNESKGYGVTIQDIIETITECKCVWLSEGDKHRWYIRHTKVVCVDGMFIGFDHYETTGDNSASDMGLDFNIKSVKEYEPKEIKTTTYVVKE